MYTKTFICNAHRRLGIYYLFITFFAQTNTINFVVLKHLLTFKNEQGLVTQFNFASYSGWFLAIIFPLAIAYTDYIEFDDSNTWQS